MNIDRKISHIENAQLPELMRLLASYESEDPDFVRDRARFLVNKLHIYTDMLRAFDRSDSREFRVRVRDGTFVFDEKIIEELGKLNADSIKRLIASILNEKRDALGEAQTQYTQDSRRTINVRERTILELLASEVREFSLTEIVRELARKNLAKTSQAVTAHLHRMQSRDLVLLVRKGTWKITESGRGYLSTGHLRLVK